MMFWKPIQGEVLGALGLEAKRLGHGLYELWCRCDLCRGSGPNPMFTEGRKGDLVTHICRDCRADANVQAELEREGWTWQQ